MPQPANLVRAELREIKFEKTQTVELDTRVSVQFNPEKLGLAFSNRLAGGGENTGTAKQFVNRANTTLSVELWFDVTVPLAEGSMEAGEDTGDVRNLTRKVIYFFTPRKEIDNKPPAVRFIWGTLLFDGLMTSMSESLEFFSEEGKPMRARVTFSILKEEISVPSSQAGPGPGFGAGAGPGGGLSAGFGAGLSAGAGVGMSGCMAGTQPLLEVKAGDTLQDIAGSGAWQDVALANNIENPRKIDPGALVNVNISGTIKVD